VSALLQQAFLNQSVEGLSERPAADLELPGQHHLTQLGPGRECPVQDPVADLRCNDLGCRRSVKRA
jgi:hypothetical protein